MSCIWLHSCFFSHFSPYPSTLSCGLSSLWHKSDFEFIYLSPSFPLLFPFLSLLSCLSYGNPREQSVIKRTSHSERRNHRLIIKPKTLPLWVTFLAVWKVISSPTLLGLTWKPGKMLLEYRQLFFHICSFLFSLIYFISVCLAYITWLQQGRERNRWREKKTEREREIRCSERQMKKRETRERGKANPTKMERGKKEKTWWREVEWEALLESEEEGWKKDERRKFNNAVVSNLPAPMYRTGHSTPVKYGQFSYCKQTRPDFVSYRYIPAFSSNDIHHKRLALLRKPLSY